MARTGRLRLPARRPATRALRAAVLCPIGFVCDHIEVLYDLDREAAAIAAELGLTLTRAAAVNDHPRFVEAMADVVRSTIDATKRDGRSQWFRS